MDNYTCMLSNHSIGYGNTLLEACNNAAIGLSNTVYPIIGVWIW